jgi:hypothetical protein
VADPERVEPRHPVVEVAALGDGQADVVQARRVSSATSLRARSWWWTPIAHPAEGSRSRSPNPGDSSPWCGRAPAVAAARGRAGTSPRSPRRR